MIRAGQPWHKLLAKREKRFDGELLPGVCDLARVFKNILVISLCFLAKWGNKKG
jgi:hypothetical protein